MIFHQAVAGRLREHGIGTLFGVLGDGNMLLVDSYDREPGGRYISVANESTAMLAALGCSRVSGTPGVATVTHGPGLTNTMTALVEGVRARLPALLIVGATARDDPGHFQRAAQDALVAVTGAGFRTLRRADTWAADLDEALHATRAERRPVVLEIPVELMEAEVPAIPFVGSEPSKPLPLVADEALDEALGIMVAARRPLLLVGRGATSPGARTAVLRLAERLGAPVMTTLGAKDLVRGLAVDRGLFGGLADERGIAEIASADCVVVFGAGLNDFTTGRQTLLAGKAVVVCEIDPQPVHECTCLVVGDAGSIATAMADALDAVEHVARREVAGAAPDPVPPATPLARIVAALDAELPDDRIVVTDAGRFMGAVWRGLRIETPRDLVPTMHFGSIGCGMGYAIGVAAASPGRLVVLAVGDGGLMLGGLPELSTLVRHGLRVLVVVLDDGAYGAEYVHFVDRDRDPGVALFDWPSFAQVAEAMGLVARRVAEDDDPARATRSVLAQPGPGLIDVLLDPALVPRVH